MMEFFIQNVKDNPSVWNTNLVSYRDIMKKEAIWETIAKNCGMPNGKEAKIQWKRIRDSHREAMRRRKVHGLVHLQPWKYEEDMKFILQVKSDTLENTCTDCYDTPDTQESKNDFTVTAEDGNLLINEDSQNDTTIERQRDRVREENRLYRDKARRKTIDESRQPKDALGHLFESMCQKTRQLPIPFQLRVQREIFNAVTKAEEEALVLDPISSQCSPMSSTTPYLIIKEDLSGDD